MFNYASTTSRYILIRGWSHGRQSNHGTALLEKVLTPAVVCYNNNKNISTSSCVCKKGLYEIKFGKMKNNLQKTLQKVYDDEFIEEQIVRYNLSKNRLARMMSKNPDTFTQADVRKAIRYLFPSNLSESSKPSMEHPSNIFLTQKKLWDENHRPFDPFYFTGRPAYYRLMHGIYEEVLQLQENLDDDIKNGTYSSSNIPAEEEIISPNSRWMDKNELSVKCGHEVITDELYNGFIAQLERLIEEPYAYNSCGFIYQFRIELPVKDLLDDITQPQVDELGREFVEESGRQRSALSTIRLYPNGTGKITVNGEEFSKFFSFVQDRQLLLTPFTFCGKLFHFDVEARVRGGHKGGWGHEEDPKRIKVDPTVPQTVMAGSIRYAIARAMRTYLDEEKIEMMRRAGLLTEHIKFKERKQPGLYKARKRHPWKAR